MRPIERIDNFLMLVSLPKLAERWDIDIDVLFKAFNNAETNFLKYWNENPDQRIGQVLINLCLIPDTLMIWNDEERDILREQGVPPREYVYWTSYYDKNQKLLDKPKAKLIKDLDTDHLHAIVAWQYKHHAPVPEIIRQEIELRKNELV